jgi:hypothetical protein
MSKDKRQRIDDNVSDTVVFLKKWIFLAKKKRLDFSGTVDYITQYYIKSNDIIKKTDITEQDIKINDDILTKYRVDTNIPSELRDDIKIIQYMMNKDRSKEEKRLTMDDVIKTIVDKYMDLYPDIKKIKIEDKFLIQRIRLEELSRKSMGLGIDD